MKKIIATINLFGIILFVTAQAISFPKINPEDIDIVRDEWGTPHIFGKTDAEVAYGLAWANGEDAFEEMQDMLLVGKGLMGKHEGKDGAAADFFRHVIGTEEIVKEKMSTLPQDFLKYIDGYVQGANAFAKKHKDRIKVKKLFPVTAEDVIASYVVAISFLTDASGALNRIYNGHLDKEKVAFGSNAFAINGNKSSDGDTYLCVNPHFLMSGSFSFYEAHVQSEEGLNMHGALFQGGTSVFMGNNEHLGWGMTWNYFDRGDVYKLKMHPKKKLWYEYDGEWHKLEKRKVWLKVKVGKITIPVPKKSYWSEIGPVVKAKESGMFYAFRYPAYMDVSAPLQWYKMNKAQNYEEWRAALDLLGIGMFNIVYADKDQNIFYVSYGQVPYREKEDVDYSKVLPGHTSEYVWQRLHTVDELPQVENPECGYVFNTNNSPFRAACYDEDDDPNRLPDYVDERPGDNNRSIRLQALMDEYNEISYDRFQEIKFDNTLSKESYLYEQLAPLREMNPEDYPDIADVLELMLTWDLEADPEDIRATILLVTIDNIFRKKGYGDRQFIMGYEVEEELYPWALRETKKFLLEHYGTIEVPLKDIFVARKGDLEVPSPGFPDALAANYGKKKGSKYVLEYGDSYTHFVRFTEDGATDMRTLIPFGNSNDPESKYYFGQAELFKNQQTKEVSLDKDWVYEHADVIYHPK